MKLYCSVDSPNFLVAEIAASIESIYPKGLAKDTPEYDEHPKIKKIQAAVADHYQDYNTYIKPWASFLLNLPKGFKRKIRNSGFVHELAYSGQLILQKYEDEFMIREKAIIFNVSWLADFLTVYGVDRTFIKESNDHLNKMYPAINVITVSPFKEFEKGFEYLTSALRKRFPEHKFIPFSICRFLVQDIHPLYYLGEECTVYNALFNNSLDLINTRFLRGDNSYGAGRSSVTVTLRPPSDISC